MTKAVPDWLLEREDGWVVNRPMAEQPGPDVHSLFYVPNDATVQIEGYFTAHQLRAVAEMMEANGDG